MTTQTERMALAVAATRLRTITRLRRERDTALHQLNHTSEWRIEGTWLVEVVDECTCGGGGPYGHEPSCGLAPLLDLSRLRGWPTNPPNVLH